MFFFLRSRNVYRLEVFNFIKRYLSHLTLLFIWQRRPSWQGHEWCKLKTSPPSGSSQVSPNFKYFLQMLSPCSLAQHNPGWQSSDVLQRLVSVPFVLGAQHRPHKHFKPLQQLPSRRQISLRIRHRSHLREYRLHDCLFSQSLLEVHIYEKKTFYLPKF